MNKQHDSEQNATAPEGGRVRQYFAANQRRWLLVLIDMACYLASYVVATLLMLMTDEVPVDQWFKIWYVAWPGLLLLLVAVMTGRFALSVYRYVWRYPNVRAYTTMVIADACSGVLALLLSYAMEQGGILYFFIGFWRTFCVVVLFNLTTLISRFAYQLYHQHTNILPTGVEPSTKIGVAIIGAGQVGCHLVEELRTSASAHYKPICFIDHDVNKIGMRVADLKVYAEDEHIIERLRDLPVQEVFVAIPELSAADSQRLIKLYSDAGYKVKRYDFPTWDMLTAGGGDGAHARRVVRDFRVEDLLGRQSLETRIDSDELAAYYRDRVVLVTGGGGSIGSEICRQIAKCGPKKLIILDIYENNAYEIQQELRRAYGSRLELAVEIASVRDVVRLDCVFKTYRPEVVFHAAAHKHVPLMEHSACEAIKNNVLGTYNTANMAEKYGVEKFVLISTDKAVNPTNVMGASKRMCEMVVQCRTDSRTAFTAVRFGNVLGSNGSVIPLFQNQIEMGGPVTITDKRIIRYFMTIPEASRLVLLAGSMAKDGELFVLDMGKQVKILDMAENMIRAMGYTPYVDIDIVEIGLRPGEKLYEELLIKTETLQKTSNNLIFIETDQPLTRAQVEAKLTVLRNALRETENELSSPRIKEALKKVVPTFHDPEEVNAHASEAREVQEANA